MKSFSQFLKEANMSPAEAHRVFSHFGIDSRGKSKEELKVHYTKLIRKHHPDLGGNPEHAKLINAAWDTLKSNPREEPARPVNPRPEPSQRHSGGHSETPEWAWAGHSGGMPPHGRIHQNNYRDLNFIKKDMWERSGRSREEHTIHNFDGRFFRGTISVYGNDKIHPHMANAMREWDVHPSKAIFVSTRKEPRKLKMIWANGKHLDKPIETEHEAFNHNPGNDQRFTRNLSDWIDYHVSPYR